MRTYKRAPVDFVRGEGALLWDADGKEYLDFLTGISVCSVGHCHPAVVEAVREQVERLMHVSNLFYTEPMARLAERLSESSLGGRVFFSNSGTEANECAIKIARKHAHAPRRRRAGDRQLRERLPRPHLRRPLGDPGLAANEALGPMLPGFRAVPAQRRRRPARGGGREHRGGPDRADPGRGRGLPDRRGGAAGGARGLRRGRGAADLRRDPDRRRPHRLALGLRADAGAPRRHHQRQGARRRLPDRRLRHRSRSPPTCSSPATTARPSPAARSPPRRRWRSSTSSTTRRCCGACASCGAYLRERLEALDGVRETRGRGLMVGVGLEEGIDAAAVGADLLERGLVVNVPGPTPCACCRRW